MNDYIYRSIINGYLIKQISFYCNESKLSIKNFEMIVFNTDNDEMKTIKY